MKIVDTDRRSGRGIGVVLILGLLALGAVAAFSASDLRRYLRMRRM